MFFIPVLFHFLGKQGITQVDWYILMGITITISVLLEIPAGMFADRFGTKLTLISSTALSVITMFIFPLFHTFWGMVIPHFCLGISMACDSGTLEAYVHDNVGNDDYKKSFGRLQLFSLVGVVAVISSGFIVDKWSYSTPFYWTGWFHLVAFLLALLLPSNIPRETPRVKHFKQDVKIIRNFHPLLFLIGIGMFTAYVMQDFLKLESVNLDIWLFGPIIASLQLFYILGKNLAHKVKSSYFVVLLIVLLSTLAIAGLFPVWWAIPCFWSIAVTQGLLNIITDDKLMSLTKNKASIVSIKSIGNRVYFAVILLVFGLSVGIISMPSSLVVLTVVSVVWIMVHRARFVKMMIKNK